MSADLLLEIQNLKQEVESLKEQLANRRCWVLVEKSSIYDDYLMKVVGVKTDFSKADAWKINKETEMITKRDLERPVLKSGNDDELDNYNKVTHQKEEGEKFLGCELLRFVINEPIDKEVR